MWTWLAGIGVLVLLLGVQTYRLTDTERLLAEEKTATTRLTDNNATLTNNQKTCQMAIDEQNAKVEEERRTNEMTTAAAQAAADAARADKDKAVQNLTALRAQLAMARAPLPVLQACSQALEEGRKPNQ